MAAQNEPNFALFTCKARKFSMSSFSLFPFCVVHVFRARIMGVLCAYYAIDTMQDGFRKLKAKILENGGMLE